VRAGGASDVAREEEAAAAREASLAREASAARGAAAAAVAEAAEAMGRAHIEMGEMRDGFAAEAAEALGAKHIEMEDMRIEIEAKFVGAQERHHSQQQLLEQNSKLKRELGARTLAAASFTQQRTLDGKVVSGIDTITKVYVALNLKKDEDVKPLNKAYGDTKFYKAIADMTEHRVRTLIRSLDPAIKAVLGGSRRAHIRCYSE
jgi:hypothetical protein